MKDLDKIPDKEREHFMRCPKCEEWFDMRDLSQVFEHEHSGLPKIKKRPHSKRLGDSTEWDSEGRPIRLN